MEDTLAMAARNFVLHGQAPGREMELAGYKVYFGLVFLALGRAGRKALRAAPKSEEDKAVVPGMLGGRYKPLSDADVERIHRAALDVLA